MATEQDIKWASYRDFEGPFYRGKIPYVLPAVPNENDRIIQVITATEGGHYDAYNGYDSCISTSGLIQWCERAQYSVSDMLGEVARLDRILLLAVDELGTAIGYSFEMNEKARFRFFDRRLVRAAGEVDTQAEQQRLFLHNSSGKKGTWDAESKSYAKRWAAAISSIWEQPAAQRVQLDYTVKRLQQFIMPPAAAILNHAPDSDVGHAVRAAFISFAANNPTWASKSLVKAATTSRYAPFSLDWFIDVLRELTFGFGIAIYPIRYRAIRPVLENFYNIDLPDFADELKQQIAGKPTVFKFDVVEIQNALLSLGFDLGPTGADGIYGGKTVDAVLSFEQLDYGETNKVPADQVNGYMDEWTARKLEEVLEKRGIAKISTPSSPATVA